MGHGSESSIDCNGRGERDSILILEKIMFLTTVTIKILSFDNQLELDEIAAKLDLITQQMRIAKEDPRFLLIQSYPRDLSWTVSEKAL